ncbi:aminodeoxychorismate synthase component I [Ectothiorhodospiraceae bacterium WFHF3C12]|nr:aminodeoxychorismate synthase component I [Ectothiorhodospiraceae bacterium WFHF3C12]
MLSTDSHHTLPYPVDPTQLFRRLRRLPWAMWLDSGCDSEGSNRYDIMVADPVCTLETRHGVTAVRPRNGEPYTSGANPLEVLRAVMAEYGGGRAGPPPFAGGAVGYFSYELGRRLEGLPGRASPEPEMAVGIYPWALVLDRERRRLSVCGDPGDTDPVAFCRGFEAETAGVWRARAAPEAAMDAAAYAESFAAVQRYIQDGDCYQVNLANRFRAPFEGDPLDAYAWLRRRAGGPFSAFLDVPGVSVLSVSPERFLRLNGGRVETRPIKGTRPRRRDPAADAHEREALLASAKDRAENVMIVDLLRNDLGKVCRPGSVHVPSLCALESYSTVHHLVSQVVGELREDCGPLDLLGACLPGGSITGAPKHRAMQIIDELEPAPRGVYCGAIGYVGFDGGLDLNIAIRTATCAAGSMDYWAGGGLVADSLCEAEYEETRDKARAFLDLFGVVEGSAG